MIDKVTSQDLDPQRRLDSQQGDPKPEGTKFHDSDSKPGTSSPETEQVKGEGENSQKEDHGTTSEPDCTNDNKRNSEDANNDDSMDIGKTSHQISKRDYQKSPAKDKKRLVLKSEFTEGKNESKELVEGGQQKDEDEQSTTTKSSAESNVKEFKISRFADLGVKALKEKRQRLEVLKEGLRQHYDRLIEHRGDLAGGQAETISGVDRSNINRRIAKVTVEINDVDKNLEGIDRDLSEIESLLIDKESLISYQDKEETERGQDQQHRNSLEEVKPEYLFKDGNRIKFTTLFVVSFMGGLGIKDFKEVVLLLLKQQEKDAQQLIQSEQRKIHRTNVGKDQSSEERETARKEDLTLLSEEWKSSANKPDSFLNEFCIELVSTESGGRLVFSRDNLKNEVQNYLRNKQPLFLSEQVQHVLDLQLILHKSNEVAKEVTHFLAEVMSDYPREYSEEWIFKVYSEALTFYRLSTASNIEIVDRVSSLLYELQSSSNTLISSYGEDLIIKALERLILETQSPSELAYFADIFANLLDKQLRSGSLGKNSARSLLRLLRDQFQSFDSVKVGDQDESPSLFLALLQEILERASFYSYLNDIIEIFGELVIVHCDKKGIDSSNRPVAEVIMSEALLYHCIGEVNYFPLEEYGVWPSAHPLFSSRKYIESSYRNFETLFSLLLIPYKKSSSNFNFEKNLAFLVTEWGAILFGFNKLEPESCPHQAVRTYDELIEALNSRIEKTLRRALVEQWSEQVEFYLKRANYFSERNVKGDRQKKRQFMGRRSIVKYTKRKMKSLNIANQ